MPFALPQMMKKFNVLKIVHIRFDDHSFSAGMGGGAPDLCMTDVFGVLVKEDETSYCVASWVVDQDQHDKNNEFFTIRKHPGLKINQIGWYEVS